MSSAPNRFAAPAFLILFALLLTCFELGRMDIVAANEGQRAVPPMEMIQTGNYITPTINGQDYLAKPPLLYWAIAGVYKLTGAFSEWAARIPTALSGVLLTFLIYLFVRRHANPLVALWAGGMTLTSYYILERMRVAQLDVPLAAMTTLAVIFLFEAFAAKCPVKRTVRLLVSGAALGAAILLKGPVPFLFLIPAWMAIVILKSDRSDLLLKKGLRWSIVAFLLEVLLKFAAWVVLVAVASKGSTHPPNAVTYIRFPYALILLAAVWLTLTWHAARSHRLSYMIAPVFVSLVGCAIAAPWALAILQTHGWPYIHTLLQGEVVERTHTASAINSGTPFYFFVALPLLLAPWGFLLPWHLSARIWRQEDILYRFSLVTGWLSVLLFSLIAGKEYEYILPAMPLLLIPTAYHLAATQLSPFLTRYKRLWLGTCTILFVLAALTGPIYGVIAHSSPVLIAEQAIFGAIAIAMATILHKSQLQRVSLLVPLTGVIFLMVFLHRSFYYTGDNSPRTMGAEIRALQDAGYVVEAFEMYPGLAFYTRTPTPEQKDPRTVLDRLRGDTPYYYVARSNQVSEFGSEIDSDSIYRILGPLTRMHLVLLGNRPLPTDTQFH